MSKGTVNKVILIGALGQDPTIKHTGTGTVIANLTLATTGSYKDKSTGEYKDNTEWHRVVMYNKLADLADQYLEKGCKIYLEGRLQTRKWEKDGQTHYTTEIICEQMQILKFKSSEKSEENEAEAEAEEETLNDNIPF